MTEIELGKLAAQLDQACRDQTIQGCLLCRVESYDPPILVYEFASTDAAFAFFNPFLDEDNQCSQALID